MNRQIDIFIQMYINGGVANTLEPIFQYINVICEI